MLYLFTDLFEWTLRPWKPFSFSPPDLKIVTGKPPPRASPWKKKTKKPFSYLLTFQEQPFEMSDTLIADFQYG